MSSSLDTPQARSLAARAVALCTRRSGLVIVLALIASLAAAHYVSRNFAIDSDAAKLLPSNLPWREREIQFQAAFPQNRIAVVVDSRTPEITERATSLLAQRMAQTPQQLHNVYRPDGGPFFQQNGLLFLSDQKLRQNLGTLVSAQPLLGTLAADPSLRGLMDALTLLGQGVARGESAPQALTGAVSSLSEAVDNVLAGKIVAFSWRTLFSGEAPNPHELRQFILVEPVLDHSALQPGAAATTAIRSMAREVAQQMAAELALDPRTIFRVRLTGNVPLADEEFATLADRAYLSAAVTMFGIILMLWLAVRSIWMIVAMLLTLLAGLSLTTAVGLLIFHAFNLISVAFVALFVGLGIDFCIQLGVAFRTRLDTPGAGMGDTRLALRAGADDVGAGLALAAASTSLGFLSFLPTQYIGVSQLGLIAGIGMLIACALTLTLLPALLCRLPLRPDALLQQHRVPFGPVDRFLARRRPWILAVAVLVATAGAAALPHMQFDLNPLHLRSSDAESVATLLDISKDPLQTPNTLDALMPSLAAAEALGERLEALPEVAQTLTLQRFIPEGQAPKLAAIADAASIIEPTLEPIEVKAAPTDQQNVQAILRAEEQWRKVIAAPNSELGRVTDRLAGALGRLREATPDQRTRLQAVLLPPLNVTLEQLRASFQAHPVTLADLPEDLNAEWQSADGRARLRIFPRGDSQDNATLRRFVAAVSAVEPDVTGPAKGIEGATIVIVHAFIQAAIFAGIAICALLLARLRSITQMLLAIAPLALASLMVFGICVAMPIPLNFENVIALPLLLGIGVAFSIYFVMAWRAGKRVILESSLAHAILFSALTTASGFGSLALSKHPGTASLGVLLLLSLAAILASVLLFLPALLAGISPPRRAAEPSSPLA